MKKVLACFGLIICLSFLQSFFQPQERTYYFQVPESKVNTFVMMLQGNLKQVSAADYKEIAESIIGQAIAQNAQFTKQDSLQNLHKTDSIPQPEKVKNPKH